MHNQKHSRILPSSSEDSNCISRVALTGKMLHLPEEGAEISRGKFYHGPRA